MATPTVYVICGNNCRYEGMTKEQILTAIMQAVKEGEIRDVDAGFVTTINTINGKPLKFFYGPQAEYDALTAEQKAGLFALITNDTTKEGLLEAIARLEGRTDILETITADLKGRTADLEDRTKELLPLNDLYNVSKLPSAGYYVGHIDDGKAYFDIPLFYWAGFAKTCTAAFPYSLSVAADGTLKVMEAEANTDFGYFTFKEVRTAIISIAKIEYQKAEG